MSLGRSDTKRHELGESRSPIAKIVQVAGREAEEVQEECSTSSPCPLRYPSHRCPRDSRPPAWFTARVLDPLVKLFTRDEVSRVATMTAPVVTQDRREIMKCLSKTTCCC